MKFVIYDCGHKLGIGWVWRGKRKAIGFDIWFAIITGMMIFAIIFFIIEVLHNWN